MTGEQFDITFLTEILEHLAIHETEYPPLLRAQYYSMMLFYKGDEIYFSKLKNLLQADARYFSQEDHLTFYVHASNYCRMMFRKGNSNYLREQLNIYKQMLAYDLLFSRPSLASSAYKNIVTVGLQLKEFDWTENFIQEYKARLPEKYREGVFNYNLAQLNFNKVQYHKTLRLLQRVDFIDPFYRISFNILLIKTYYECDESEPLIALCNTFRNYIRRNKSLSQGNKKAYLNFGKYSLRLHKAKMAPRYRLKTTLPKIIESMDNASILTEHSWLQEKIDELQEII